LEVAQGGVGESAGEADVGAGVEDALGRDSDGDWPVTAIDGGLRDADTPGSEGDRDSSASGTLTSARTRKI
jgi:hypothetical protein